MRIEAYNQIQSIYQTKKINKTQGTTKAEQTDNVQISSFGQDIQSVKAALQSCSDIREDLTTPIKEKIQSGTYEVSGESFAEKLLQKYTEMR